ncbi:MAG: response regulator transcription factor [Deltaproteobacteria bacterium]|nr:response regulator transcription factor [Deltaproteobacteria bacterium]
MPQISVLISDDHTLIRYAVRNILEGRPDYRIIGEAANADGTITMVRDLKPDILILGLGLPGKSGIEVLYQIREEELPPMTVVLTMHESELMIRQAIMAGANAYILKTSTPEELLDTLQRVREGVRNIVPNRFQYIIDELTERAASNKPFKRGEDDPLQKLSKREREVFFMLADGMPNRTIAKELFISPRTVETHRARVIKKMGFTSTADLIRYAIKNNLLIP